MKNVTNPLQAVMYVFRLCFEYVYKFYTELFMLTDEVSAWDFLIVLFVVGGLIALIVRAFGASGMASAGGAAVRGTIRKGNSESYQRYKENRERKSSYAQRYKSEKK